MMTIGMWAMGIIITVASVLPGWENEIGQSLTLYELWFDRDGFLIMGIGIGMFTLGTMIYQGYPWVRHLLMTGIVTIGFSGFIGNEYDSIPTIILLVVAFIAIGLGLYFFYLRSDVISHFTRNK